MTTWIILGGTSTIARVFARRAAERGEGVILAGRDADDLAATHEREGQFGARLRQERVDKTHRFVANFLRDTWLTVGDAPADHGFVVDLKAVSAFDLDAPGFAGPAENFCRYCTHADGTLKKKKEIRKGIARWMQSWQPDLDDETAAKRARRYMRSMPAWCA